MKKRWRDLTPRQKTVVLVLACTQVSLAVTAWIDLWRRPAATVNGSKPAWAAIIGLNFIGPIAYFLRGRRREHAS